jgi:hypothetical protein
VVLHWASRGAESTGRRINWGDDADIIALQVHDILTAAIFLR